MVVVAGVFFRLRLASSRVRSSSPAFGVLGGEGAVLLLMCGLYTRSVLCTPYGFVFLGGENQLSSTCGAIAREMSTRFRDGCLATNSRSNSWRGGRDMTTDVLSWRTLLSVMENACAVSAMLVMVVKELKTDDLTYLPVRYLSRRGR